MNHSLLTLLILWTIGFNLLLPHSFGATVCGPNPEVRPGDHGKIPNSERHFAYISGDSSLTREEVLLRIKKPRTYRPDSDVKIDSHLTETDTGWINTLSISVKPVFFLPSIQWKEIWTAITPKASLQSQVIFEKTEGTKFIRFFCGSFTLESLPESKMTRIKIYEEIDADRRNHDHLWSSVQGSLKTLEAKPQ